MRFGLTKTMPKIMHTTHLLSEPTEENLWINPENSRRAMTVLLHPKNPLTKISE
jgi:hypothetical protein